MGGARPIVKKDETYRKEHLMASSFEKSQRNIKYGFICLFMSVSEACGELKVTILNQSKKAGVVGCRTLDDTASAPADYGQKDEQIEFKDGDESAEFFVSIVNDDSFEPDEDFLIELYDPATKKKLEGRDTQVKITILDDDKPGKIVFENARVRQAVNMNLCTVTVKRVEGSDGEISVKYRTINYESGVRSAVAGEDYTHTEGTLVFKQ